MKAALLIGNGLNRCYEETNSPIAWSNLLKGFALQNGVDFHDNNSFPLEFECLVNDICEKDTSKSSEAVIGEAKEAIVETIQSIKLGDDPIHQCFMELGIDQIMTTNYDYILEKVCDPDVQIPKGRGNTRYSINRCIQAGGKHFHHIHGEAKYPRTLCLGYEHYASTVQKMCDYVKDHKFRQILAPNDSSSLSALSGDSWIDLMFTHDVYIVGLKLEMCEIDLWWLLTYRAFLHYLNDQGRKRIANTITFYDTTPRSETEQKYQKDLFERVHVKYVYEGPANESPVNKAFENAYRRVAQKIRNDLAAKEAAAAAVPATV